MGRNDVTTEQLKTLRAEGLTLQQIADKVGLSKQAVHNRLNYTQRTGKRGRKPLGPPPENATRRCNHCGDILPLEDFPKHAVNPWGHGYTCKECEALKTVVDRTPNSQTALKNAQRFERISKRHMRAYKILKTREEEV